jgi:hypothetical protein
VILTGIEEIVNRSDLLDRAIIIYLPRIDDVNRRDEKHFLSSFETARPRILGALLDMTSAALREEPTVSLERLPRMADFARWISAVERELGLEAGSFLKIYRGNREAANELALDASPIGGVIMSFVTSASRRNWRGTASDLLIVLNKFASEDVVNQREWPRTPRSLSNHLRRIASNFRFVGVQVNFEREAGGNRTRYIALRRDA